MEIRYVQTTMLAAAAEHFAYKKRGIRFLNAYFGVGVPRILTGSVGCLGPYTTCYNRFVRWRQARVWDKINNTLAGAHDAAVQRSTRLFSACISTVRCITRNRSQSIVDQ
jgi:hypothetical protein